MNWNKIFKYELGSLYWQDEYISLLNGRLPGELVRTHTVSVRTREDINDAETCWVHKIVWEMHYGPLQPGERVCFLDGNKENTLIENLSLGRKVIRCRFDKGSVYWHMRDKKWAAKAVIGGNSFFIGTFDSKEEATQAVNKGWVDLPYLK